jgi:hypothetical protein
MRIALSDSEGVDKIRSSSQLLLVFSVFSVFSVALCPLCSMQRPDKARCCNERRSRTVFFDTEDTESQRTQSISCPSQTSGNFVYTLSEVERQSGVAARSPQTAPIKAVELSSRFDAPRRAVPRGRSSTSFGLDASDVSTDVDLRRHSTKLLLPSRDPARCGS